jgi:hypothetical protein
MGCRHVSGLAAFLIVCLCSATTAHAQIHAACCMCGNFYELQPQGAGFARNHVDFCPDCVAKYGPMNQALDRLQGRLKGLKEAADLALQELREGLAARDKARDAIYGTRGSAVGFFKSLASFAGQGTKSGIKTVAKTLNKGITWYNRGQSLLAGDYKPLVDAGTGMLTDKAKDKVTDTAIRKAAAAAARRHYEQTRDASGSTKTFLNRQSDLKGGLAFAEGAKDFYEKTDKLANTIQDYLDAREKVNRAQKDWEDATEQMMKVLEVIEKVRHCQAAAAGNPGADARPRWRAPRVGAMVITGAAAIVTLQTTAPAKSAAPAATTAPALSLATTATELEALIAQRALVAKLVADDPGPASDQLRVFLKKLPEIRSAAQALVEQADVAWPPVAVLAMDVQPELGPELTRALVELAEPAWAELEKRYDALMALTSGMSLPGSNLAAADVAGGPGPVSPDSEAPGSGTFVAPLSSP